MFLLFWGMSGGGGLDVVFTRRNLHILVVEVVLIILRGAREVFILLCMSLLLPLLRLLLDMLVDVITKYDSLLCQIVLGLTCLLAKVELVMLILKRSLCCAVCRIEVRGVVGRSSRCLLGPNDKVEEVVRDDDLLLLERRFLLVIEKLLLLLFGVYNFRQLETHFIFACSAVSGRLG